MRHKLPQCDPVRTHARKATAERRVGTGAHCACGESRPEALITGSDPIICAECNRTMRGQSTLDEHHVAGKANSPVTVPVPVNDHRAVLTSAQNDWPKGVLDNPEGSPLIAAAAYIRGFVDTLNYLVRQLLWVAELLEMADSYISQKLGSKWWRHTPLERFAPKGR